MIVVGSFDGRRIACWASRARRAAAHAACRRRRNGARLGRLPACAKRSPARLRCDRRRDCGDRLWCVAGLRTAFRAASGRDPRPPTGTDRRRHQLLGGRGQLSYVGITGTTRQIDGDGADRFHLPAPWRDVEIGGNPGTPPSPWCPGSDGIYARSQLVSAGADRQPRLDVAVPQHHPDHLTAMAGWKLYRREAAPRIGAPPPRLSASTIRSAAICATSPHRSGRVVPISVGRPCRAESMSMGPPRRRDRPATDPGARPAAAPPACITAECRRRLRRAFQMRPRLRQARLLVPGRPSTSW